jgi:hypothetical protein
VVVQLGSGPLRYPGSGLAGCLCPSYVREGDLEMRPRKEGARCRRCGRELVSFYSRQEGIHAACRGRERDGRCDD